MAGKATRDGIFLSYFDVTTLPKMVIVAALVSMAAVILVGQLLARFGPSRVIPTALGLSGASFMIDWVLYYQAPMTVAVLLYLQMAAFGAVLISGFWSVVNERFDPHTAKSTIAKVAAAATLGGVIGGIISDRVAVLMDARAMLIVLMLLHLGCMVTVAGIGRTRHSAAIKIDGNPLSGVKILFGTRYLLLMAILTLLGSTLAALLDYAFKAMATEQIGDREALVVFFARFYAVSNVATFLVQISLGPQVLRRFGIGATLSVMPAVVFLAGILNVFAPKLWAAVLLRGGQVVFSNSFSRSAFELLYTPVSPVRKRPTKSLIDVASERAGDILGGGLLLALLAMIPAMPPVAVVLVAVLVTLVLLLVIGQLYRGYVEQLADSLRDGSLSLSHDDVVDATTRHTLAEVSAAAEREQLMARIKARKRAHLGLGEPMPAEADAQAERSPVVETTERRLANAIADLNSGDTARIREFLLGDFMDRRLVPSIIPLLGVDMLAEDVRMELRWMVPQTVGALTDALLDPDLPVSVRQRIPGVMEVSHSPRVIHALQQGLHDPEFNIRYSCGRALARMRGRDDSLDIDDHDVYELVRQEVRVDETTWRRRELEVEVDLPIDLEAAPVGGSTQTDYSLAHVFNLLSLVLDSEAVYLALRAVVSNDRALHGTALEYLENVLPEDIRDDLWLHLGEAVPRRVVRRGLSELVDELRGATVIARAST
ncbi:MAG: hypothetical protein H6978_07795 [Gammaproteobacteria bacterium]|nr:hypothetical protein [Gammaproteobacteria bacterium]